MIELIPELIPSSTDSIETTGGVNLTVIVVAVLISVVLLIALGVILLWWLKRGDQSDPTVVEGYEAEMNLGQGQGIIEGDIREILVSEEQKFGHGYDLRGENHSGGDAEIFSANPEEGVV